MTRRPNSQNKRRYKKETDARRAELQVSRKRQILEQLGIWALVKGTPLASAMLESKGPPVKIEFGNGVTDDNETRRLHQELVHAAESATFDCQLLGNEFTSADYFVHVAPMMDCLHRRVYEDRKSQRVQLEARDRTQLVETQTFSRAFRSICDRIQSSLIQCCNLRTTLFYLNAQPCRTSIGQLKIALRIHAFPQTPREVIIEGKPRPTVACGMPNARAGKPWISLGPAGIHWAEWHASKLGIADSNRVYRILIQSHVFDQLEERLSISPFLISQWERHDWLWQSLQDVNNQSDPDVIVSNQNGVVSFLVKYIFYGYKVGYLSGEIAGDNIVVRTFLFLTMDGTPEGNQLWKRLRLTKQDKKYAELDQLVTFVLSDVAADPQLAEIFEECGCGQLLRMVEQPIKEDAAFHRADEIRKFLNLSPRVN